MTIAGRSCGNKLKIIVNALTDSYRNFVNGYCTPGNYSYDVNQPRECEGPIGRRHAISKIHLNLIADSESKVRANRDYISFHESVDQYESMLRVPIRQFSAGKWACQKHDQMFTGLDVTRIDLSDQEMLFKAVYRVVLRQNLLHRSRYCAIFENIQSEENWQPCHLSGGL